MREVVNTLMRRDLGLVPDEMTPYYQDVYDHVLRATEWTESLRDLVTTILETNLTIQGNRLNVIMKKVTSWAAIIAVPTAVTGFYGQNVPYPGFARQLRLRGLDAADRGAVGLPVRRLPPQGLALTAILPAAARMCSVRIVTWRLLARASRRSSPCCSASTSTSPSSPSAAPSTSDSTSTVSSPRCCGNRFPAGAGTSVSSRRIRGRSSPCTCRRRSRCRGSLPVAVSGPLEFTLLAVWTQSKPSPYTAQTHRVVAELLPLLSGPVVLAGDFNAPGHAASHHLTPHLATVDLLDDAGLVSAFAAARGVAHSDLYRDGPDTRPCPALQEPTYYHWRRRDLPWHIDHVFVRRDWTDGIATSVGSYDDWVATGHSDHVPVVVDLQVP